MMQAREKLESMTANPPGIFISDIIVVIFLKQGELYLEIFILASKIYPLEILRFPPNALWARAPIGNTARRFVGDAVYWSEPRFRPCDWLAPIRWSI